MRRIRILAVGRLKTPHWRDAAAYYRNRLSHYLRLDELEVKDADAKLPLIMRKELETDRLLKLLRPSDVAGRLWPAPHKLVHFKLRADRP